MFRRLANSQDGKELIKYLDERLVYYTDPLNIKDINQLEGYKLFITFVRNEIINKINAFSGTPKVGESEEEFR